MQTRSGCFLEQSDFEFSQKINAQDGTGNSCLQKTGSEHFALELGSFGEETLRGDVSHLLP
jgi:hypothetical protein